VRVEFPTIPEVTDGMVASAATFNTWSSALTYLLGQSHAPYASTYTDRDVEEEYRDTYQSVTIGYAPYRGEETLYYAFDVYQNSGGANNWHARIGFYGDDDAWHWVYETNGTDGAWAHKSGTHGLTAGELAQLTDGEIYQWRIQIKGDAETYNTYLRLWQFGLRAAISDWPASPTFVADAVPDADDFNTIRTAAGKLADFAPEINWCGGGEPIREVNGYDSWYTVQRGVWRYRPESLLCVVRYRQRHGFAGRTVRWQVQVRDTAGNEAAVYESGDLATTGGTEEQTETIDLTAGAAAAALAAAGIALTQGDLYRCTIRMKRTTNDAEVLDLYGGMIVRSSEGTPDGAWVVPNAWAHLDDDVGPTNLNAYWTDLDLLYSGNEALFGDTPVICYLSSDDSSARTLHGIHRKRWLHYRCIDEDDAPRLYYGTAHGQSQILTAGSGWQTYDLEQIAALPYSATYWLSRTLTAFEADRELL